MINSTKIKIPKKYENRIEELFKDSDGYWLYLEYGWCWDSLGLHIIHEDTQRELLQCLRNSKKCSCEECSNR